MRNINSRLLCAASFVAAALALPAAALAQKSNLLVAASISPRTVSHDGVVQLEARIQNDGRNRAVVLRGEPGWTAEGGVSLQVIDSSGNTQSIKPELGGPSAEDVRTGSRKLVLKSGEGVSLTRQLAASEIFPRPGTYTVIFHYRSPQPGNGNRSVNPDELEGEVAQSSPLTVVVR